MAGVVIVMAIAVFVAGVLIGVIAALAMGLHREGRMYALTGEASSRLGTYARRLNGLGHRDLNIPPGGPLSR
jgi:hypothetical protein